MVSNYWQPLCFILAKGKFYEDLTYWISVSYKADLQPMNTIAAMVKPIFGDIIYSIQDALHSHCHWSIRCIHRRDKMAKSHPVGSNAGQIEWQKRGGATGCSTSASHSFSCAAPRLRITTVSPGANLEHVTWLRWTESRFQSKLYSVP